MCGYFNIGDWYSFTHELLRAVKYCRKLKKKNTQPTLQWIAFQMCYRFKCLHKKCLSVSKFSQEKHILSFRSKVWTRKLPVNADEPALKSLLASNNNKLKRSNLCNRCNLTATS
jgi:hypothetical protein